MSTGAPKGLGRIFDLKSNPNTQRRDDSRDAELRQMQSRVGDGARAKLIKSVSVSTSEVSIEHKLNKALTGWRIADIDQTGVTVKRIPSPDEAKWLRLKASGSAVISLEVW